MARLMFLMKGGQVNGSDGNCLSGNYKTTAVTAIGESGRRDGSLLVLYDALMLRHGYLINIHPYSF